MYCDDKPSEVKNLKAVLCVGNAVVDVINVVKEFPLEDSEQFGVKYYWQRGGNATNNSTVLSMLNTPCEFMGVLASSGAEANWLQEDFRRSGIATDHCVTTSGQCPVATSILSTKTGSRTILAFLRGCPELTHAEFKEKLNGGFDNYSWIHFELRNKPEDVRAMMRDVTRYNEQGKDDIPVIVSLEVENPNIPHPEQAMFEADFIFISKDFAQSRGCKTICQALEDLHSHCKKGSVLICAWGDEGAGAIHEGKIFVSPAKTDVRVVDSLGAGDTLNAGFIHSFLKQSSSGVDFHTNIQMALDFGCQLAGYKCSIYGYSGLKSFQSLQ